MYFLKKFLKILILLYFCLQCISKADDISDFEIEGMSIGDSLLNYMTNKEIEDLLPLSSDVGTGDEKFIVIWGPVDMKKIYDQFQVTYKFKDKNYKIHAIDGQLDFSNNYNGCKIKMKEVEKDIKVLLENIIPSTYETNHIADKTGKSRVTATDFKLKNGGRIQIWCTDWSNEIFEEKNWKNELNVSIRSKEYQIFIDSPKYNN